MPSTMDTEPLHRILARKRDESIGTAQKIKQTKVAQDMGVSQGTVSRLELGLADPQKLSARETLAWLRGYNLNDSEIRNLANTYALELPLSFVLNNQQVQQVSTIRSSRQIPTYLLPVSPPHLGGVQTLKQAEEPISISPFWKGDYEAFLLQGAPGETTKTIIIIRLNARPTKVRKGVMAMIKARVIRISLFLVTLVTFTISVAGGHKCGGC